MIMITMINNNKHAAPHGVRCFGDIASGEDGILLVVVVVVVVVVAVFVLL